MARSAEACKSNGEGRLRVRDRICFWMSSLDLEPIDKEHGSHGRDGSSRSRAFWTDSRAARGLDSNFQTKNGRRARCSVPHLGVLRVNLRFPPFCVRPKDSNIRASPLQPLKPWSVFPLCIAERPICESRLAPDGELDSRGRIVGSRHAC